MASKYVAHWDGITTEYQYCGDGTSSSPAASAGAVGAWNDLWSILEGAAPAYGSIAAGDYIYIRSKDSGGNDLLRTMTVDINLGASSATSSSPVIWSLDNGINWSGVTGSLTYSNTGAYEPTVLGNNHFESVYKKWVFYLSTSYNSAYFNFFTASDHTKFTGLFFDAGLSTVSRGADIKCGTGNYQLIQFVNCGFKWAGRHGAIFISTNGTIVDLYGANIELVDATETDGIFSGGVYASTFHVYGGSIYGVGATSGTSLLNTNTRNSIYEFIGMDIPKLLNLPDYMDALYPSSYLSIINGDSKAGCVFIARSGVISSRDDGNFPYLNAILDDSVKTPWSWYAYPANVNAGNALSVTTTAIYSGTAATKTITMNFLVGSGFTELNKGNCILVVAYTDNVTGAVINETTKDLNVSALDSSTANWSAVTYGATFFDKRELSLVTSNAIKQDTIVTATIVINQQSSDATDILFVCPVPELV